VSEVYGWAHSDLVAAVASVVADAERCPGCGLTDSDAWWVESELVTCPTCEDRDRKLGQLRDMKSTAGWRAKFRQLTTVEDSMLYSAAARFTQAGAEARDRWRRTSSL
jgi:hypothetical protein